MHSVIQFCAQNRPHSICVYQHEQFAFPKVEVILSEKDETEHYREGEKYLLTILFFLMIFVGNTEPALDCYIYLLKSEMYLKRIYYA